MKRPILVFSVSLLAAVFLLFIFRNQIVLSVAKNQIQKIFPGAIVSLSGCEVNPVASLQLKGVRVQKNPAYDFKIGVVRVDYRPAGLWSGNIGEVSVKGAQIKIDTPKRKLVEFARNLNLKKSGRSFAIGTLSVSGAVLDLDSSDILFEGDLDAELGVKDQALVSAVLLMRNLKTPFAELHGFSLAAAQNQEGKISFKELKADKLKVIDAAGIVRLHGSRLDLSGLSGALLGGQITVNAGIKIAATADYSVRVDASGLSLEQFTRDFELGDRFEAVGLLDGSLSLEGAAKVFRIIDGDFSVREPGGKLIIKDKQFLERLAATTNQPLNMIVENFRDYHYNTGIINAALDHGNIVLDLNLEGAAGKRSLSIILHDVFNKEDRK